MPVPPTKETPARGARRAPPRRRPSARRPAGEAAAIVMRLDRARMAEFFRAVSDPTRQEILLMLDHGECSATEVVGRFRLSQSTISRHLGVLRHAGLVRARREGKRVIYGLNCESVAGCCQEFFGHLTCCAPLFRPGSRKRGGGCGTGPRGGAAG